MADTSEKDWIDETDKDEYDATVIRYAALIQHAREEMRYEYSRNMENLAPVAIRLNGSETLFILWIAEPEIERGQKERVWVAAAVAITRSSMKLLTEEDDKVRQCLTSAIEYSKRPRQPAGPARVVYATGNLDSALTPAKVEDRAQNASAAREEPEEDEPEWPREIVAEIVAQLTKGPLWDVTGSVEAQSLWTEWDRVWEKEREKEQKRAAFAGRKARQKEERLKEGNLPEWCEGKFRSRVEKAIPIVYGVRRTDDPPRYLTASVYDGDVLLSLWSKEASEWTRKKRILLANPDTERPPREKLHLFPLFKWRLASALHDKDDFRKYLRDPAKAWRELNHRRTPVPRRRLAEQEWSILADVLETHHASIRLQDELGANPKVEAEQLTEHQIAYTATFGTSRYKWVVYFKGCQDRNIAVLNGTSPPVHQMNNWLKQRNALQIEPEYLRFFGENVHAELGSFNLVEATGDLLWRHLTKGVQTEFDKLVRPALLVRDCTDEFLQLAFVNYGQRLFVALIRVDRLDEPPFMLADAPLISDLPIHPHVNDPDRDTAMVLRNDEY
ncbi:MAG: hypothetical protein JO323_02990 [Acidobacteriia bacterium]|nr:hypothetical protein [Terriglobia bacterium]